MYQYKKKIVLIEKYGINREEYFDSVIVDNLLRYSSTTR